ncbi:hypothetical protein thalar_03163 [Litoreibacter arenae DSM 19593]|uniref:Uncharacterized protein n=1 Tax=Litoreibacter arenae DSM 19593 TaxID=1123360 RepID=S9RH73_9RHOB|nr:hypothetical protein thalar_03163 [Litoreibacter arenae DSM 19593]
MGKKILALAANCPEFCLVLISAVAIAPHLAGGLEGVGQVRRVT